MDVIYQTHPDVIIATNTFRNVETLLKYENVPLIEVGKFVPAGYTTRINVYHSDGTHIAVVKGSQIYLTEEGKKASIKPRFEPNLTAYELDGRTIIELRREGAAALKGSAEMYAPEGVFIKATDAEMSALRGDGTAIRVAGVSISGGFFDGHKCGIHVTRDGVCFGGEGGTSLIANIGDFTVRASGSGRFGIGRFGIDFGTPPESK